MSVLTNLIKSPIQAYLERKSFGSDKRSVDLKMFSLNHGVEMLKVALEDPEKKHLEIPHFSLDDCTSKAEKMMLNQI